MIKIYLKENKKEVFFSSDSLDDFQVKTGVSNNNMQNVTNFIRQNADENSVPSNYKLHVSERSQLLEEFYKTNILEFEIEKKRKK